LFGLRGLRLRPDNVPTRIPSRLLLNYILPGLKGLAGQNFGPKGRESVILDQEIPDFKLIPIIYSLYKAPHFGAPLQIYLILALTCIILASQNLINFGIILAQRACGGNLLRLRVLLLVFTITN